MERLFAQNCLNLESVKGNNAVNQTRKPAGRAQSNETTAQSLHVQKVDGHIMPPLQEEVVQIFRTPRKRFALDDVQNRLRGGVRMTVISASLFHELFDRMEATGKRVARLEAQAEEILSVRGWQRERMQIVPRKEVA